LLFFTTWLSFFFLFMCGVRASLRAPLLILTGSEVNDQVNLYCPLILVTTWLESEIIKGANLLILNFYYWIIYCMFLVIHCSCCWSLFFTKIIWLDFIFFSKLHWCFFFLFLFFRNSEVGGIKRNGCRSSNYLRPVQFESRIGPSPRFGINMLIMACIAPKLILLTLFKSLA
jgi:hypothetical protein